MTGLSPAAIASGLQRLRRQLRVFSPTRGLYVVIPPEFRSWGVVPADWFIDDLMRHLGRRHYVALLSAAAYHGAAQQASQVFQVMTDGRVLERCACAGHAGGAPMVGRSHDARDGWWTTTAPVRISGRCAWPPGWTWGSPSS